MAERSQPEDQPISGHHDAVSARLWLDVGFVRVASGQQPISGHHDAVSARLWLDVGFVRVASGQQPISGHHDAVSARLWLDVGFVRVASGQQPISGHHDAVSARLWLDVGFVRVASGQQPISGHHDAVSARLWLDVDDVADVWAWVPGLTPPSWLAPSRHPWGLRLPARAAVGQEVTEPRSCLWFLPHLSQVRGRLCTQYVPRQGSSPAAEAGAPTPKATLLTTSWLRVWAP
ncbi:hypothetical protein P7K49_015216 [Saguinus oedipus]|uniref:Uncharacterized protein n=1 Tax=Saguinus oedipus TaxID=9490 RepID=A0ABQ9V8Z4_SAGOE|nr:hypothetical protein P7K49_015216 [Saguinus oedipus]